MTGTKPHNGKVGRPPAPYGKTKAMKVPIALFDQVRKIIEEWKASEFKDVNHDQ